MKLRNERLSVKESGIIHITKSPEETHESPQWRTSIQMRCLWERFQTLKQHETTSTYTHTKRNRINVLIVTKSLHDLMFYVNMSEPILVNVLSNASIVQLDSFNQVNLRRSSSPTIQRNTLMYVKYEICVRKILEPREHNGNRC